jgi:hypothetical protein
LAVLVGFALAIAACGGDSDKKQRPEPRGGATAARSGPAPPAKADPCSLLTSAAVEDALGAPFKRPERNAAPSGGALQVCTWFREGGARPLRFVQVSVGDFAGGGRAVFDRGRRATPGAQDVPGIGDAAYSTRLAGNTKVTTLKDETVISVTSVDEPSATKLAKLVLGRL